MKVPVIELSDAFLILIFSVLIISMSLFYQNYKISFDNRYKWFTTSLITRLLGGFGFALIYIYYYGGGDTVMYYQGAHKMYQFFFENPLGFFQMLFTPHNRVPQEFSYLKSEIYYLRSAEEWFLVRIASALNIFAFNSYWVLTMLFSLLAFISSWFIHLLTSSLFKAIPNIEKVSLISFLFVPSVLFWGSGILKDTMSITFLMFFFYAFNKMFFDKKWNVFIVILLLFSAMVVYKVKSYVLLTFLLPVAVGVYVYYKSNIKNLVVKYLALPFVGVFGVFLMIQVLGKLADETKKYQVEDLNSRMRGFHSWHTHQGGSTYSLGEFDYSTFGILKKTPAALNVSLFRPYLPEVRSAVMLISSIENTFLLIIFIIIFWHFKSQLFSITFNNYFLTICFVYFILLGIVTGITSYNFGALARYRIPYLPFFVFWLLYFYNQKKQQLIK